jgi:hypothetical protein
MEILKNIRLFGNRFFQKRIGNIFGKEIAVIYKVEFYQNFI